jgi:hypothetical protein
MTLHESVLIKIVGLPPGEVFRDSTFPRVSVSPQDPDSTWRRHGFGPIDLRSDIRCHSGHYCSLFRVLVIPPQHRLLSKRRLLKILLCRKRQDRAVHLMLARHGYGSRALNR